MKIKFSWFYNLFLIFINLKSSMSHALELPLFSKDPRRSESVLIYHDDYSEVHSAYPSMQGDFEEEDFQFKWKANTYKYRFNILLFLQALIINCLYLFGAGGILEVIKLMTGWKLLNNLRSGIWLLSKNFKILIIAIFPLIIFVSIDNNWFLGSLLIQNLVKKELFIAIFLSCMIAHSNKRFPKLLSSVKLPTDDLKSLYAKIESKKDIENEFKETIMRLKLDITCLYFKFLQDKVGIPELKRNPQYSVWESGEQMFQYESGKVAKEVPVNSIVEQSKDFERNLFERYYFNHSNELDGTYLYGYNLGIYYLEKAFSIYQPSKVYPLLIASFNLVGPYWVKTAFLNGDFGEWHQQIFDALMTVLNFGFALWIIQILDQGVTNLKRRVFLMQKMGILIEFGKQRKPNTQEPTINIFDPMSLRTWLTLRKVFMNFDDRRMKATVASLTFILILHSFLIAAFILQSFDMYTLFGTTFQLMLAIYSPSCFIYLGFFSVFATYGYLLNREYEHHNDILRNNKTTVSTLFDMYPHFTGRNPLIPKTYIYREGLKALNNPNGEYLNPHEQEKRSEIILRTYKQISKELNIEGNKNPFCLMGIPNKEKLFLAAALSVLALVLSVVISQLPEELSKMLVTILKAMFGIKFSSDKK